MLVIYFLSRSTTKHGHDTEPTNDKLLDEFAEIRNVASAIMDLHWDKWKKEKRKREEEKGQIGFIYRNMTQPFEYTLELHKTLNKTYTAKTLVLCEESASERWTYGMCIFPWCAKRHGNLIRGACDKHYAYLYKHKRRHHSFKRKHKYPEHRRSSKRARAEDDEW